MPEMTEPLRFQPVLRALLDEGLIVRFRAGGRSMLPTIHDGDILEVEPVETTSIQPGDVIVVETPGCVRAHRVVGDANHFAGTIITQGDALRVRDIPVLPNRILGRVTEVERNGRRRAVQGTSVRARVFLRRLLVAVRKYLANSFRSFLAVAFDDCRLSVRGDRVQ